MRSYLSVAIDGPAGAGKSTIAKAAAKALDFVYLDTGAIYRTVAWHITMLGIGPKMHLVASKTIARSEGKAVRVIDKRKLLD